MYIYSHNAPCYLNLICKQIVLMNVLLLNIHVTVDYAMLYNVCMQRN